MVLLSMRPNEKSPGAAVSSGAHTPAGLLCMPSTISRANFDLSLSASFRECSHCSLLLLEYGSSASWSLRAAIFPLLQDPVFWQFAAPGMDSSDPVFWKSAASGMHNSSRYFRYAHGHSWRVGSHGAVNRRRSPGVDVPGFGANERAVSRSG